MEDTFFVHLNAENNSNGGSETVVKKSIWPSLIMSIRWILSGSFPIDYRISSGVGVMINNGLAIIIEGFVSDIINVEREKKMASKDASTPAFEAGTWESKKKKYETTFNVKMKNYKDYDAIVILFLLRNNIAHGKAHVEISGHGDGSTIQSKDDKYQEVRKYLTSNKMLVPGKRISNVEDLFDIPKAIFFLYKVRSFLDGLIADKPNDAGFEFIKSQLEHAFQIPFQR